MSAIDALHVCLCGFCSFDGHSKGVQIRGSLNRHSFTVYVRGWWTSGFINFLQFWKFAQCPSVAPPCSAQKLITSITQLCL